MQLFLGTPFSSGAPLPPLPLLILNNSSPGSEVAWEAPEKGLVAVCSKPCPLCLVGSLLQAQPTRRVG